jgi:hypothetical protein
MIVLHSAAWSLVAVATWQPKNLAEWLIMTISTTGATIATTMAVALAREGKNGSTTEQRSENPEIRSTEHGES